MGAFIWFIILIVFISKMVKAQGNGAKSRSAQEKKQQSAQQYNRQSAQQYSRQSAQQYSRQSAQNTLQKAAGQLSRQITQQVEQQRNLQMEQQRKQQELKDRLLQRYGNENKSGNSSGNKNENKSGYKNGNCQQVPQRKGTVMQQGDILSRAAANVMETQHDELEHMMEPEKHGIGSEEPKAVKPIDSAGTDDLMKTVNDLIIMGYQPKLSFERDFIGEGMELLNRFDVPDMVQGS